MSLKQFLFEGTPDTSATAATAGVSQITLNGGSVYFRNAAALEGNTGLEVTAAAGTSVTVRCPANASATSMAVEIPFRVNANSGDASPTIFTIRHSSGIAARFAYMTSARDLVVDGAATSGWQTIAAGLTADTWYRLSVQVQLNAAPTTTNGTITCTLYAGNTTTTVGTGYSSTTFNLGTAAFAAVDLTFSNSGVVRFDTLQINDGTVTPIGPYVPAANNPPTCSVSTTTQYPETGSTVTVTASASDTDGTISAYAWTCTQYPGTVAPTINNAATANASFLASAQGRYTLQCIVTDNGGATSAPASVTVYVHAAAGVAVTVWDVTLGAWTVQGAGTKTAVLNDTDAATGLASPPGATGQPVDIVLCPFGPGEVRIKSWGLSASGSVSRVRTLYKEDGTTVLATATATPGVSEAQAADLVANSTTLGTALSDRRALILRVADTAV